MKENSRKIKEIEVEIQLEYDEDGIILEIMDCLEEGTIVHLNDFFERDIYVGKYAHLIIKQD